MPAKRRDAAKTDAIVLKALEALGPDASLVELRKQCGFKTESRVRDSLARLEKEGKFNPEAAVPDSGPRTEWTENGNEAVAVHTSTVRTLDGLLEACEVDTDIWQVDKWVANKWDQSSKTSDDRVLAVELWQVKAWFIRKVAIVTEFPAVQPVSISLPKRPVRTKKPTGDALVGIVVPDLQVGFLRHEDKGVITYEPFHDRRCISVVLQVIRALKPDLVLFLGDVLDLPEWSDNFIKSPEFYFTSQPSVIEASWIIGQARKAAPEADVKIIEGNHDERLRRALKVHLMAACNLKPALAPDHAPPAMSVENMLSLEEMDVEYIGPYPKGSYWFNDHLEAIHGEVVRSKSGGTVSAMLQGQEHSSICGHIHRVEQACETRHPRARPKTHTCISLGTCSRIDGAVPAAKHRNNWQQGFGVVHWEPEGRQYFHVDPIPIVHGRAIVEGKVYEGTDYADQLAKDTGWNFEPWGWE